MRHICLHLLEKPKRLNGHAKERETIDSNCIRTTGYCDRSRDLTAVVSVSDNQTIVSLPTSELMSLCEKKENCHFLVCRQIIIFLFVVDWQSFKYSMESADEYKTLHRLCRT